MKEERHQLPKECRQQVRSQLFQQRENIDFDPHLKKDCAKEIKDLCPDVPHGLGQVNKLNASVMPYHLSSVLCFVIHFNVNFYALY